MGPIQDHENEKLLHTDKAIVMARKMLLESAQNLAKGIEPPALDSSSQRVRAAGVLLHKDEDPLKWAKEHLSDSNAHPVYSL